MRAEGPHFCVGGDLRQFTSDVTSVAGTLAGAADDIHAAILGSRGCGCPLVVAVHGAVAGGGMGLVLTATSWWPRATRASGWRTPRSA